MIVSCKQKERDIRRTKGYFEIPIVEQERLKDSLTLFKVDFLDCTEFLFYGKYKFTDTLKLSDQFQLDTLQRKDYLDIYEYEKSKEELNKLNFDGFQLYVDYKTTICVKKNKYDNGNSYFPVYLVNETSHTKVFQGADNNVFGIQEATDSTSGQWRPIESVPFGFCGNGYFWLKVKPEEFVLFLVPKYEGDQKQQMRIRLKVNDMTYLSPPFFGTFNYKQFIINKENPYFEILNKFGASEFQFWFYGAVPKGYDPKYW
jgi:hypothetical protein